MNKGENDAKLVGLPRVQHPPRRLTYYYTPLGISTDSSRPTSGARLKLNKDSGGGAAGEKAALLPALGRGRAGFIGERLTGFTELQERVIGAAGVVVLAASRTGALIGEPAVMQSRALLTTPPLVLSWAADGIGNQRVVAAACIFMRAA